MGCGNSKEGSTKDPAKKDKQPQNKGEQSGSKDSPKKENQKGNTKPEEEQNKKNEIDDRTSKGPPVTEKPKVNYVTRKEINSLSENELQRFFAAIRKMMENKEGPGTSDFFEIAGYHGWPSDFCQHGTETFPVWHRAYLVCFEQALIKADKSLGNDGNLGLPFWDWSKSQLYPEKIREMHSDFPENFFPSKNDPLAKQLQQDLFTKRRSMQETLEYINSAQAPLQAKDSLLTTEHWKYASTRWRGPGVSIESSHNSIHMACGYPMTSIQYAAFDILFWLHHCNVDRFFQKYLTLESDSYQEFSNAQRQLEEQNGEKNRAVAPLHPFIHPQTKKPFMPSEGYEDTKTMGFVYADLPDTPVQEMRTYPTLAVFEHINTLKLNKKSYLLHIFVSSKSQKGEFQFPESTKDFQNNNAYAGWGPIFGGKGKECSNCKHKQPFHVIVDISQALQKSGVKASDTKLNVICQDEFGDLINFSETVGIPEPSVQGPFFEDQDSHLQKDGASASETLKLQKYLSLLGYYEGKQDGEFGEKTQQAVKNYQNLHGLENDGIVGPNTKGLILKSRNDNHVDNPEKHSKKANFKGFKTLQVFVGTQPGYLHRGKLIEEVKLGFEKWNQKVNNYFKSVEVTENQKKANISILFGDRTKENLFAFDKVGGNLAFSTDKAINFDISDRWVLQNEELKINYFRFLAVLIHEIGHVFGLSHSGNPQDLMSPFYNEARVEVSKNDADKFKQLYGIK